MKEIRVKDLLEVCKNSKLLCGNKEEICQNFSKDTRTIQEGDVYVGIKGERFDGNQFYPEAIQNGAKVCILQDVTLTQEEIEKYSKCAIILVEDTIQALQEIAKKKRSLYSIPVVAITGSVGKTSTREIVSSVLSQQKNILVTEKNMNSYIGMPLMTLKLEEQEMAVLEAGIDFVGEMDILNKLLVPDVAVVTNIGTSHIGKFGSQDIIFQEKTKIADGLKGKKILLLNGDDEYLRRYENPSVKILYYSIKDAKNIVINENTIEYDTLIYNKEEHIVVNALGNHNILNSLVAIKIGEIYNISVDKIKRGIFQYQNISRRMEKISFNNITIIDDTYNASPSSMQSGLISIDEIKDKRKIAVLADILELGDYAKEIHLKMGKVFKDLKYDVLIAYGENMKYLIENAKKYVKEVYYCKDSTEAEKKVREIMRENDVIYFKGSNSMFVNKIVDDLKKDFVN